MKRKPAFHVFRPLAIALAEAINDASGPASGRAFRQLKRCNPQPQPVYESVSLKFSTAQRLKRGGVLA